MRRRVENVVIWKPRAVPGERIIPRHLKLAILSRGRIDVPPLAVAPIVDEARARGAQWPDRLTKPLTQIYEKLPLVVELFQIQRAALTPDQIDEAVTAYLMLKKAETYPHCSFLEWSRTALRSAADRRTLEEALGLDLTRLFTRPRVRLPKVPMVPRHLLLAYFCVPASVNQHLRADPHLTEPLLPSPLFTIPTRLDAVPPMPPLEGRTDPRDELNLRKAPTTKADSLGVLAGQEAKIRLLAKHDGTDADGEPLTWYQIETLEPLSVTKKPVSDGPSPRTYIAAQNRAWVAAGGVKIAAAPWPLFRRDLRDWEAAEPLMVGSPLAGRITGLRQQSHRSNLPFDEVIGAKAGKVYKDDLKYVGGRWQMFLDYEAVIAPDGRWVDLQHIFVGLDVLGRKERDVTVSKSGVTFDAGTNWAAATWAGDLGSAVADSQTQGTGAWSSYAKPRTVADYMDFFLQANAPDWDLTGDLDPWGIRPILAERSDVHSVDDLLSLYYEDVVQPILDLTVTLELQCPFNLRPIVRRRSDAIRRFLLHYGFYFPEKGDEGQSGLLSLFGDRVALLLGQHGAKRMAREIHLFADVWRAKRDPVGYVLSGVPLTMALDEDQAIRYFLEWLGLEAMMHCVRTQ